MKKVIAFAAIIACSMMVFSCKNTGKKGASDVESAADSTCAACADSTACAAEATLENIENIIEEVPAEVKESLKTVENVIPAAAAEVKATFNGGDANSFQKYVQSNLEYPAKAKENGEEGKVLVSFVVNEAGKITNAQVVKSASESLDAEALRVINSAPDWTPAQQNGKNVACVYTMPVVFKLI